MDSVVSNVQASGPIAARFAKSLERVPKAAQPGTSGTGQERLVPDGCPRGRLHPWTKAAWSVRFLAVIDQIRQLVVDRSGSSEATSLESLNLWG